MDEAEREVQMEQSSQAGSAVDPMELEQGEDGPGTVLDADMEVHDIEAEGEIKDMQESMAEDEEMAAEMAEQEQAQLERDWKEPAVEPAVIDLTDEAPEETGVEISTEEQVDHTDSNEPQQSLPAAYSEKPVTADQTDLQQSSDGLATPKAVVGEVSEGDNDYGVTTETINDHIAAAHSSTEKAADDPARYEAADGNVAGGQSSAEQVGAEVEADRADEAQLDASFDVNDYITGFEHDDRRPLLQKDYLNHVDTSQGEAQVAPHVSLSYDNQEYSLFRPSSSPSGDNEEVLLPAGGDDGSGQDTGSELYFGSLTNLMRKIHDSFPQLRGDGENELIFDFGILDMQISEDNVYASSVSLFDLDRIRIGMCQPELDRLHVSVFVGKRFVYKFNELAEHVFRMYAGSDDSGTIYEETVVPDEGESVAVDAKHTDTTFQPMSAESAADADAAADYVNGDNVEDLADTAQQLNEYEDADGEAGHLAEAGPSELTLPGESLEEKSQEGGDSAAFGDAEPDTLEHLPEYEEAIAEEVEYADGAENGDEGLDNVPEYEDYDDITIEAEAGQYEDAEKEDAVANEEAEAEEQAEEGETVETVIQPDAPLEEAAEQAEAYEEAVVDAEEGADAEGDAHAHLNGTTLAHSEQAEDAGPQQTDIQPTEEEPEYYHNLASPTNEEAVIVESSNPAEETTAEAEDADDVQAVQGSVVDDVGHVEEQPENDPSRGLPSKRSRQDLDAVDDADTNGDASEHELEAKRARVEA